MTNFNNTTLYTGVTNSLVRRAFQHKNKLNDGFTRRYNLKKLIYYELYNDIVLAIAREKQIKGGSRAKKVELINGFNPLWADLYEKL